MKKRVLATTILSITLVSGACSATDDEAAAASCAAQTESVDKLIERSPSIVIAIAAGDAQQNENIDLKSIQKEATKTNPGDQIVAGKLPVQLFTASDYLKGDGPREFPIIVAAPEDGIALNSFAHDDEAFWSDPRAGRSHLTENCEVETRFTPGATYLIFNGPPHVKAYEAISADDDVWLVHVREKLTKF